MNSDTCICTDDCASGFNPLCECTHQECSCTEVSHLIGAERAEVFQALCDFLNERYSCQAVWKKQRVKTKKWKYEYKFTKGSKTLCGFYLTDDCLGFMVILGQKERDKIEQNRIEYTDYFRNLYDMTQTYHDGKWLMIEPDDFTLLEDCKRLVTVKRKPER